MAYCRLTIEDKNGKKINSNPLNITSAIIDVDDELSTTSTNPVQNKVITIALNAESSDRASEDATLKSSIEEEAATRASEDATLKSSIEDKQDKLTEGNAITISSNNVIGVNTSYVTNDKNYQVQVDSSTGGLYVNVPWENSEYTLPIATSTTLGGVKAVTKTDDMTQPVGIDEDGLLYMPSVEGVVKYSESQNLTSSQQTQARENIDAQTTIKSVSVNRIYPITTNLTNCTEASTNESFADAGEDTTLEFIADGEYSLPSTITVTNVEYNWDNTTGVLVLKDVTSSVSITISVVEWIYPKSINDFTITVKQSYESSLSDDTLTLG